ncbi:hypothetical protein ACOMHN_040605 [Nucella lapillus]
MTSKISCTDSSNCFEDVESDDLSLGTSIASDHTLSADDSERKTREKKKRIVKQLTQRKQLLHESQLLRVELQQKNVVIGGLKSEHAQHIEDLEERLNDVTYKKQIVQARLQAELLQGQDEQDETKKRQETISKEVELLKTKQQQLEAANERLLEKAAQVRLCLRDLSLSPQRYYQLKGLPAEDLSLRDYIAPHPDLQSAVGNAPLSSKHPTHLPTTDCLLSITPLMGGQPSDAPALSPPSPLQQGGQSSNAPALSPPSPLPQGSQPIALALSPSSPLPQDGQPSDAPGLSPSSSTLLLCPSDSTLSICHLNSQSAVKTVNTLQTELDHLRTAGRAQDEQIAASAGELRQLKER